jgi:hypothetical protein
MPAAAESGAGPAALVNDSTVARSSGQQPHGAVRSNCQAAMAAFVVGEPGRSSPP